MKLRENSTKIHVSPKTTSGPAAVIHLNACSRKKSELPQRRQSRVLGCLLQVAGTSAGVSAQNVACGRQTRFIPRLISRKSAAKTGQFVSGITTGRWENLWKALSSGNGLALKR